MSAVLRAARGGLSGRRLQALIVGLVLLAATATSAVALGLLANAHGSFDRAFAAERGADVTTAVDTSVASPAQLAATARLAGVTAAAGPFAEVTAAAAVAGPGVPGSSAVTLLIVGRSSPGGPVDDLTLDEGHWPDGPGQIVMARGEAIFTGYTLTIGARRLTVVGIAESATGTADGWVLPSAVDGLGRSGQAQMLYRFADAGTPQAIAADVASVRAALTRGALLGPPASYLTVRQAEESSIAPWVPFIIAFGVIALVISVLIVVNVVGGAVLAGTTRIGVLKAIGFTPVQVVACYVLLVAAPAAVGCAAGTVCGNLLAIPMLRANAKVYNVGALAVPFWVDATVPLTALALAIAAAIGPASRAGRMSTVQAIAAGRAPRPAHGFLAHRMLARLASVPRPVTLGLATPFARPGRTLVTWVAIASGAAAVTFGIGLTTSLHRAYADISQSASLPVLVSASAHGPDGPASLTASQRHAITAALAAQPGTLGYTTMTQTQLGVPGVTQGLNVTAYGSALGRSGLALISGRWYSGSSYSGTAEADVNTLFLTDTGTTVGSTYQLTSGAHRVTVRIVGEALHPGNSLQMYLSSATLAALDPGSGPQRYDVALRPGTSPQAYGNMVSAALGDSYQVISISGGDVALLALYSLDAMLTALIIAVAGLGVLNTVALQIREQAHDIGVFKALGMTPRQTLTMIVCSVTATGVTAGIAGVPAGVYLHHGVVPTMLHAANSGYPPSLISVYAPWQLVLLALAGLVIAVGGAAGPAGWAARTRTAFALRAE
jgi:putative ABC transport system permease protein